MRHRLFHPLMRQRGVAVVTALLLTTLAISIVASLFWQQQVQVRSMENQRLHLQTKWIQRGALDWASVILSQGYGQRISLDQVWATPLQETRLDQYIERERVQGENYDATLSGQIIDATSRYNLNNLASKGIRDESQVEVMRRLLTNVRLEPRLARVIADFVAAGQPLGPPPDGEIPVPTGGTPRVGTPMPLLRVDDLLAVQGVTPEMVERLRPFVFVLPSSDTNVNVNTAPAEVLAAVLPETSLAQANALVETRKRSPWNDLGKFGLEQGGVDVENAKIAVTSQSFLVHSRIRLDRAALDTETLVQKSGPLGRGGVKIIWTRQN